MYTMQAVIPHSPAEPRAALTDTQLVSHLLRAKGGDPPKEGGREAGFSFPEAKGQRKYSETLTHSFLKTAQQG